MTIRKQQAEEKEAHRKDLQSPSPESIQQEPDCYMLNHILKSLNYKHKPGILLGATYC